MRSEEQFVLDAEIADVVQTCAFRARLGNGHEFIAYIPAAGKVQPALGERIRSGVRVRARFSPYDMSRGEIVEVDLEEEKQEEK
jgi:translation initiation factor IF-1